MPEKNCCLFSRLFLGERVPLCEPFQLSSSCFSVESFYLIAIFALLMSAQYHFTKNIKTSSHVCIQMSNNNCDYHENFITAL